MGVVFVPTLGRGRQSACDKDDRQGAATREPPEGPTGTIEREHMESDLVVPVPLRMNCTTAAESSRVWICRPSC
jgi:hypothetical protein